MAKKIEINEPEEIEELLKYISENKLELIIGKFSPYCPVSYAAERTFDKWISNVGDELEYIKINVITEKKLSRAVEAKFYITHQSPQVLWISIDGNVKWHASHYDINEVSLKENLSK